MLALIQFSRPFGGVAAVMLALCLVGGCSTWRGDSWDIDTLRDERAVDIEKRLSHERTIVENPFQ